MSLGIQSKSFVSELFKQRQLRKFQAQEDELAIAKQSLILKKKCNTNVHSLLFCKSFASSFTNFSSQNEKKILEDEKSKYFDYVRKTFKEKIPQDFESENKLKRALKTKIREIKQKQSKDQDHVITKRPRISTQEVKNGSKKITQKKDTKAKAMTSKKDKQKKQITEQQAEQIDHVQSNNLQSEIDLQNDEIDEEFDEGQNDE